MGSPVVSVSPVDVLVVGSDVVLVPVVLVVGASVEAVDVVEVVVDAVEGALSVADVPPPGQPVMTNDVSEIRALRKGRRRDIGFRTAWRPGSWVTSTP